MYISIEAILIIWFPQLLFFAISFIFGALALHNFVRRRLTFSLHLDQSNSTMTTNRYLRLIAMAFTEMILGTSLTAFNIFSNVSVGLRPWISWENVHSNFSRVGLFSTSILPPQLITKIMIRWWTLPASSIIFFAFFGFGEESLEDYKKIWVWIKVKVFKRPMSVEKDKPFFGDASSFSSRFVLFFYIQYLTETSLLVVHLESCSLGPSNRLLRPLATSNLYRHSPPLATSFISRNRPSRSPHLSLTHLPLTNLSLDSLSQKLRKQPPTLNPHPKNLFLRITLLTLVPTLKCTLRPLNIRILILSLYPLSLTTAVLLLHHQLLVGLN